MAEYSHFPAMKNVESSPERDSEENTQSNTDASGIPILCSTFPSYIFLRTRALVSSLFPQILLPILVITSFLFLFGKHFKPQIPVVDSVSVSVSVSASSQPRIQLLESSPFSSELDKPLDCVQTIENATGFLKVHPFVKDLFLLNLERLTARNQEMYRKNSHHKNFIRSAEVVHKRLKWYGQCETNVTLPKVAICAIQQGSSPFIQEWISFYLVHGVTQIFVYDNSFPDSIEHKYFRHAVEPFVKSGYVTIRDWFMQEFHQLEAYDDCLEKGRNSYDWIAFYDVDEYMIVNPPGPTCIPQFLIDYQEYPGIQIRWRLFTPMGVSRHNHNQLFLEQYLWTDVHNYVGKTIAQTKYAVRMKGVHKLHYNHGKYKAVCPNKMPCNNWDNTSQPYQYVELRHYFGADWQYFFFQKLCSGSGENNKFIRERIKIIAKWFRNDCCSKVRGKTRQEVVLRKFLYLRN